ncbi:MAG TPA: D-aminoacylase [Candidatus Dormibacteraeota bacterium]|nr:D-aminoacylase [Candidatus Dormibacteraeota bacterium]
MEFDVLIRNGTVFDGTGAPPVDADVGVVGDRIQAVGDLSAATARLEVDASGQAVAPGFIDTHTHSDLVWALGPGLEHVAAASVRQGVTTEVCGNCGFTPFPHLVGRRADLGRHLGALFGVADAGWQDLDGFATAARRAGLFANLAPLVGHGGLRAGVMGFEDRPPRDDELAAMKRLLEEAFEQGAFGFSTGLIYTPGAFASTEELIELTGAVRRFGRPYVSHVRGETDMVRGSVEEAIRIGREAGVPVHLSHHKVAGRANWGRTEETLGVIAAARGRGVDVTVDVYPYTAGSTLLSAILPRWAQDGGPERMLERLRDGAVRDRIEADLAGGPPGWENLVRAAGWDGIVVATCPGRPEAEGRSIGELAGPGREAGFVFDLLIEQEGRVTMIVHLMHEADVRRVLGFEAAMIGSDGIPLPGKPHPRWAGTFSRVLGRYAREERLFDLATAIHKMTGLPAQRFGLRGRGRLERGAVADLVVFDPDAVRDRATFEEPLLAPQGVRQVLVGGVAVVADGQLTGARPGQVLTAR